MMRPTATSMELRSADLVEGGELPLGSASAAAGGSDRSPSLSWTPHPLALSYAVTCFDPDAPTGSGVWHWIVADIPPHICELPRGSADAGRVFTNDLGVAAFSGAAPPPGRRHRYEFRVHALDVDRLPVDDVTNTIARFAITGHSIASGILTVTFGTEQS